jgi:hypothetical protein
MSAQAAFNALSGINTGGILSSLLQAIFTGWLVCSHFNEGWPSFRLITRDLASAGISERVVLPARQAPGLPALIQGEQHQFRNNRKV